MKWWIPIPAIVSVQKLFLIIWPAKHAAIFNHKLVSLLQLVPTEDADETLQMIDVVHGSHDEFIGRDRLEAARAFGSVKSAIKKLYVYKKYVKSAKEYILGIRCCQGTD